MLSSLSAQKPHRRLTPATVFKGLTRELDLLAPFYERTCPEPLAAHQTLPALVRGLTSERWRDDGSRAELICTLLTLHQSTPHRLWSALLLRAFRPMLRHVFRKLCGADREERLALLLASFQEAIRRVDPQRDPVRVAMYVRQETRRAVFAKLGEQRDWEEVGFGDDADETIDTRGDARATARDRVRQVPHLALLRTQLERGALWEWVQREIPGTEAEQRRTYHRLRRRRHRILAMIQNPRITFQEVR